MPRKRKTGRPLAKVDPEQVRSLAAIGCTLPEIAAVVKCGVSTLKDRFSAIIKDGKEAGNASLRRYMWENAKAGNATMQIWLSKQLLGYHEPQPDLAAVANAMEGQTEALRKVMLAARGSIPLAPPPTVTATVSVQPATPAATPAP